MEKYASPVSYTGSLGAIFGGLTANEIAAYGGLVIGFVGLLVNWYYKAKEDSRRDRRMNDPHGDV